VLQSNEPELAPAPRAGAAGRAIACGLAAVVAVGLASGCATLLPPSAQARADLQSRSGSSSTGQVTFAQHGDVVVVRGEVRGLKPNAEHGFHVHEKGDCSSADAMSAGGHFNPSGKPHGHFGHGAHHAGDMPNLKADASGVARIDIRLDAVTVTSGTPNGIVGRSVVIHRDPDDYKSQPAGNSGPRIACGVIVAGR
jgi:Cu-Zn family superoxide dismutase